MSRSRKPKFRGAMTLTPIDDMEALKKSLQKTLGGPRMKLGVAEDSFYSHHCREIRARATGATGGNH